jgi:hypothetical protein
MSIERDRFLTEAIGEESWWVCSECDIMSRNKKCDCGEWSRYNFSRWEYFGKLWEWAQKQEWFDNLRLWEHYSDGAGGVYAGNFVNESLIHPDRFADAVYNFLKEKS